MLQFPISVLLSFAQFWEGLLNYNNFWNVSIVLMVLVKTAEVGMLEIESQDGVVEVYNITKMGVHDVSFVVNSEIRGSGDLNLDLSELLSYSCATIIEVIVHVFNI